MTAAEKLPTSETTYEYPLADIREPSIPNYRTTFEGIEDLTASVKESGIRVPLVLRPAPDGNGHELAIGARRREAATRAGLTTVPVFIREMDDEQVLVERTIENLQRVDPGPLDEAEGFAVLQRRGWSVGQLAAKVGQPTRYVLERLTLCSLCNEGRELLAQGKMLVGVAIEVAKLAPALQQEALQEVGNHWSGGLTTVAEAREAISKRVMLELGNAPFKLDDAALVPEAGPCTTCPKRTGGQADLFPDFATDLCTDSACHKSKLDALWQIRVKQAKTDGVEVLSKKAAVEALKSTSPHYGSGPFVRLDEKASPGGNGRNKTLKSLFGKELPPITLARDEESGAPVELVPRKAVDLLLKKSSQDGHPKPTSDAKAKAVREAERLQAEVRRRVMVGLIEGMEDHGPPQRNESGLEVLRVLALAAINSSAPDVRKTVANRRGCPTVVEEGAATPKKGKGKHQAQLTPEQRLEALVPSYDMSQISGLLLELLVTRGAPGKWSEAHESYAKACEVFDLNIKHIEKEVLAERLAKADGKGKAAKPPKIVHLFALGSGGATACGKAKPKEAATTQADKVTCPGCKAAPAPAATPAAKPKPAAKKKAPKKPERRPEHPATGQTVHYVDASGLSPTGVTCGGKVGTSKGKGTVSDEPEKVTCKSCRRMAALDQVASAEPATEGAEES